MKKATKQKKEQGNQSIVSQVEEQLKKLKNTKDGITDTMSGYGMAVPKAFSKYPVVLAETCHNLEEKMEMLTIEPELARRISELETKMDAVYGKRFATDLSVLISTEPGEQNNTLHAVPEEVASGASKITTSRFRDFFSLEHANFKQAETIGDNAFTNCSSLLVADFPSATTIGQYAFQNATSLENINFPAATTIGQYAFQNATSLTEANFPAATTIGQYAFENCTSLTSVEEMPYIETVPDYCFRGCSQLQHASFPNARTISQLAFSRDSSLTSINMPEVRVIGKNAFYGSKLTSAIFEKVNTGIGVEAFMDSSQLECVKIPNATSIGNAAFRNDYNLKKTDFTSSTSVGTFAFYGCEALEEINLPNVDEINHHAFKNCTSLTGISAENVKRVHERAFFGVSTKTLNLSGVTLAYPNCLEGFKGQEVDLSSITAFNGANAIYTDEGYNTFCTDLSRSDNNYIKAVHAPNLEILTDSTPFHTLRALSGITLPNYKFGSRILQFENCDQLEYAYLPEYCGRNSNDWTVPVQMFDNCDSLSSAYIPSATGLQAKSFAFCPNLKLLGIPNVTYVSNNISGDNSPFYAGTAIPKFPEYVDYRKRTSVITGFKIGSSLNQPATAVFHDTVKFIVPDDLYDEWCASPAFSACSARVVTQSWFENEGPNYQYTSGW